jgi:CRP-like cAMP-binding protein
MPSIHDLDPAAELPLVQGFGDVAPEALAELASFVVQRRVPAQELASAQGQVPLGLLLLVRGAAKTVHETQAAAGEVVRVLDVMRASCMVPDAAALDGLPSEVSVIPLRASHFFVIERRLLQKAMGAHPSLDRAILARFVRDSRMHARRVDELASGTVQERVHRLLEGLAAHHGTPLGRGRFIALPLRRRDLASMVNATTETVSRLLAKLEREGQARSTRDGIWWRGTARPAAAPDSEPAPPFAQVAAPARDSRG